ncbi:unnamed protein product [Diabrotica balteata]|uniref:Uncharacterized protein n=1 Tax=Diabrotica balteata TaxID=107213 RepID=A0A9N9SRW1_DIABA|nr:unnamed protein product [Diabrotica balteata]
MNINTHRNSKQIKTFYENIKRKIKKKQAVEKVEKYKTGGGPEQTATILLPESTNNDQDVVPIEEKEIEYLDDTEMFMTNSTEYQNCSEMVHSVSELQTTHDLVSVQDTPGPSKMITQKEKKSASKRKLSDLYDDISSLTATKKNKIKQKEDYIKDQNKNKENIIKIEKEIKDQKLKNDKILFELDEEIKKGALEVVKLEKKIKQVELATKLEEYKLRFGKEYNV